MSGNTILLYTFHFQTFILCHSIWKSPKMLSFSRYFRCVKNMIAVHSKISYTLYCLKITQNVSKKLLNFGIFHQFLSCLVTLFDHKLHFFKIYHFWHFSWRKLHEKCRIWISQFWHFPSIFVLSGNTLWPQAALFQNLPFLAFFMKFCKLKMSHLKFQFWQLKLTCLVTLFDCNLQFFKNSLKLIIFGIFN